MDLPSSWFRYDQFWQLADESSSPARYFTLCQLKLSFFRLTHKHRGYSWNSSAYSMQLFMLDLCYLWVLVCQVHTGTEVQAPIPIALDLPKITSLEYQAFLVQAMLSSEEKQSHFRLLVWAWDFILNLYLYSKKDHLMCTLRMSLSISHSKEKTDIFFTPAV